MTFGFAAIYRSNREGLTSLLLGLDDQALATTFPATPLWRVSNAFAHLTGVGFDYTTGRVEGAAGEAWTQRQVGERIDHTVREIADE